MRKLLFAVGLLVAGLAFATQIQAKPIVATFWLPNVMLQMCKSEIARGQAGFCTGYVIATWDQMAVADQIDQRVCIPRDIEYEDMLRVVVRRLEKFPDGREVRRHTEVALRDAWPCKE
jgi:hypothetical protein